MAVGEIPAWAAAYFNEKDPLAISESVRKVELRTQGEIVPVVVRSSSAFHHLGILFSLLLGFFCALAFLFLLPPQPILISTLALLASIGIGWLLSKVNWLQSLFLNHKDKAKAVHERAELEFFRQNVQTTHAQTGILIFVSLLEKQVVILADKGISVHLSDDVWQKIVHNLVHTIRNHSLGKGLVQAVESCGELLIERFPRHPGEQTELSNQLILRE